jgi:Ca-activated chloride channel family protein
MRIAKQTLRFSGLLSLLVLGLMGYSQDQKPKQTKDQTFSVQVDMVSLPVVVMTRDGRRVTDLHKEDFEVFEDKVPQQIVGFAATEEPISVALALDTSGSMERRLVRLQNEAIRFVNLLHPDDSVAIMSFADDVSLLEDFSIDRNRNAYGVKETRTGDGTAIYEAVWLALQEVLKPVKERTALVLFTDGVDTVSRKASEGETLRMAKESSSPIYCIYFNTEYDVQRGSRLPGTVGGIPGTYPPVIVGRGPQPRGSSRMEYLAGRAYVSQLSEFSGGRLFDAQTTEDLAPAFEQIAQELSSQYSIGYYSSNTKKDGKFRNIEVRVRKPGLVARTKKGYLAPKPPKG